MNLQNTQGITEQIIEWIEENSPVQNENSTINGNTELMGSAKFDSMQVLILVTWLEAKFGITIGAEHMTPEVFNTPHSIAKKVAELA